MLKKYETAIEMSLGGALQNIVTSTEEDAETIEFLRKTKLEEQHFFPFLQLRNILMRAF